MTRRLSGLLKLDMLLDLRRLFDLWVEHYDKIPEAQRQFAIEKSALLGPHRAI